MRIANGNAALRCDYCGNLTVTAADEMGVQFVDEAENLACPACASGLWNAILSGIPLRGCKHCHGQLIAMNRFEALIDQMRALHDESAIPAASDDRDLRRNPACPICHRNMDTHFYYGGGNAVISSCETCQVHWLDGGVLMKIVRAPHEAAFQCGDSEID